MAAIVVDESAWPSIEIPLEGGWINWAAPAFIRTEERDWNNFLERQRRGRYPTIESDVAKVVLDLSRMLVLRVDGRFNYSVAFEQSR